MKKLVVVILTLVFATGLVRAQTFWTLVGFQDKNVTGGIAFNGSDHIFVGAQDGVYRSTDDGITWSYLSSGWVSKDVSMIGVNSVTQTILASAVTPYGPWEFYRSTDNGNTWQDLTSQFGSNARGFASKSDGTLFVATDRPGGIYRSTDDGQTWQNVYSPSITCTPVAVAPNGYVFAGTHVPSVIRSTDNGDTWQTVVNIGGVYGVYSIGINSRTGHIFVGTETAGTGIWRSTDNGDNWEHLNNADTPSRVYTFAITSADEIYAGTAESGVHHSTDDGLSWAPQNSGLPTLLTQRVSINWLGRLFMGTVVGLYSSTPQIQSNGLVAYYPFNGDANDASGNGHHGIASEAIPTTDRFGVASSAYSFNGTSSFIKTQADNALDAFHAGTVSYWFYTPTPSAYGSILTYSTDQSFNSLYTFTNYLQKVFVIYKYPNQGYNPDVIGSTVIQPNRWYHVAVVADGASLKKIYLNGQLESALLEKNQTDANGSEWFADMSGASSFNHFISIGALSRGGGQEAYFGGKIDDIRIYDRALTANQIDSLYSLGGWPITQPPVSFYLHGTGSTANASVLTFDASAPSSMTAKYKDSPGIKFSGGNLWQQVGSWNASTGSFVGDLAKLGQLHVWIGLKNSDDVGTNFDLRAELWKNNVLVTSGETYAINGVTRNPDLAKAVSVSFGSLAGVSFTSTDVASLRVLTRVGTDGSGHFLGGHSNAVGLRLHFDAVSRVSSFDAEFWLSQSPAQENLATTASTSDVITKQLLSQGEFALLPNYPNPFNPSTTIAYRVVEQSSVHVGIYNSLGQLVRELVNQDEAPGLYSLKWDGTTKEGATVSSGVYFCKVRSGGSVLTRRMLLLK